MGTLPDEMMAMGIRAPGGPDVLVQQTHPVPRPAAGEVLIRVAAAGVNRPDVLQRQGRYPPPPGASPLPGLEVAGTIAALGEGIDSHRIGQRVCALVQGGGYAEYVATPFAQCLPVPPDVPLEVAAAMPETLLTVWSNLFERAYVVEGDTVLVHGGTSGIGSMAIALCKLFGITSIVTCGNDEKCAAALAWGAGHAINHAADDFVEAVKRITDGAGVAAVLDMVGGDYVPRNIDCLGDDGRHVSIAAIRGGKAQVPMMEIMRRRLTLTGSTLRPRSASFKALLTEEVRCNVWPFVAEGRLRPMMDRVFPLAQAAAAHARMESGAHMGKIVLSVAP